MAPALGVIAMSLPLGREQWHVMAASSPPREAGQLNCRKVAESADSLQKEK